MAQRKSSPSGKSSGSPRSGSGSSSRPGGKPAGGARAGGAGTKPGSKSGAAVSTTKSGATKSDATKSDATKSDATKSDATKPGATKPGATKPGATKAAAKSPSGGKGPATRPPARKKPKSIVNQKQTPWGLIITTVAVVLFAAAVVIVVIATRKSDDGTDAADPYRQPELAAVKKIQGVTYRVEPDHTHVRGKTVKYDSTPPVGGNHDGFWADCTGTVYAKPIANENAVHMLEHGAVWITYNASKVKGAPLAELRKDVAGVDHTALSPYPNLDSPISLQAWGYQLKVTSATDPRISQFIATLKYNKKATPEYGASCSNPAFKANPSTFGKPTAS